MICRDCSHKLGYLIVVHGHSFIIGSYTLTLGLWNCLFVGIKIEAISLHRKFKNTVLYHKIMNSFYEL